MPGGSTARTGTGTMSSKADFSGSTTFQSSTARNRCRRASVKQADATGWMAMFALNMTVMALELATEDPDYESIAIQTFTQFLAIANAIAGHVDGGVSLWDPDAGFFKDLIIDPDGKPHRIDVYSLVGLIPLFATEVIDKRLLAVVPRFRTLLRSHRGGKFQGSYVCACPDWENKRGEHLLALVDHTMLPRFWSGC